MAVIETEQSRPVGAGKTTALRDWVRALEATAPIAAHPQRLLGDVIADVAKNLTTDLAHRQADAPALIASGGILTYAALTARANRAGRWRKSSAKATSSAS